MSRGFYGNVQAGATISIYWSTNDGSGGSVTPSTPGTVVVLKDDGLTPSTAGVVDSRDINVSGVGVLTGVNRIDIDTSLDTSLYSVGSMYGVVLHTATIDGQSVNHPIASFAIGQMIGVTSTAVDNADNLAIANRALLIMGESPITSFGDSDKRSVAANNLFVPARDSVLEAHTWKTCRKLTTLVQDTTYTATDATWNANVATITFASHSMAAGSEVVVDGFVPTDYNGTYTIVSADATTITYALALASDPGDSTTEGTVVDGVVPNWKYGNQYAMPSDFIRLVELEDESIDYEIHQDKMVTNAETVKIEYVFRQTDVSMMGPVLKECISAKLAAEMSYRLDTSTSKRDKLDQLYLEILSAARNIDASQRPDDVMIADEWMLGRLGTNSLFRGISSTTT